MLEENVYEGSLPPPVAVIELLSLVIIASFFDSGIPHAAKQPKTIHGCVRGEV
jgi:hypothetical protein